MLAIAIPLAVDQGPLGLYLKREIITFKGLFFLLSPVNFSMLGGNRKSKRKLGKIVAKVGMTLYFLCLPIAMM